MKIAFCIIAEGDIKLESLKKLLASAEGVYDSVHITTNQKEYKQVEKWCKDNGFDHSHLPWQDDFSEQRNFNMSRIPDDTDYVLWADSDDVIVGAGLIRDIAEKALKNNMDSVFFTYWYGCKFDGEPSYKTLQEIELQQNRERLLDPTKVYWKGRLHETPVPVAGLKGRYTKVDYSEKTPIAWLHLTASRDESSETTKQRLERNRRLLELQLEDERAVGDADPRTLLYLMKIYAESTDEKTLRECIDMGKEYMQKSGWDAERAICASLMAMCVGKLGDKKGAVQLLHDAIEEYPYDPLLYLHLSRAYLNTGNYRAMKHWLDVALSIDIDEAHTNMTNLIDMKSLTVELMMRYYFTVKKDVKKAYEYAVRYNKLNPSPEAQAQVDQLYDLKELEIASASAHTLVKYYNEIGHEGGILKTVESMPPAMRKLPFANNTYNRFKEIKAWEDNEICIYANFGQQHFEKWTPDSLSTGIGGSETAVIRLARAWQQKGYKVTVYGDPREKEGIYDGVEYLPWHAFNARDKFNIFIQWRSSHLAGKISAKKFYVDLHDLFAEADHIKNKDAIDKIMVKSEFHKSLAPTLQDKIGVISNGI